MATQQFLDHKQDPELFGKQQLNHCCDGVSGFSVCIGEDIFGIELNKNVDLIKDEFKNEQSESEDCEDQASKDDLQVSLGKLDCLSAENPSHVNVSLNSKSAGALTSNNGMLRKRSKSQNDLDQRLRKLTLPLPQPYNMHDGPLKLDMITRIMLRKLIQESPKADKFGAVLK